MSAQDQEEQFEEEPKELAEEPEVRPDESVESDSEGQAAPESELPESDEAVEAPQAVSDAPEDGQPEDVTALESEPESEESAEQPQAGSLEAENEFETEASKVRELTEAFLADEAKSKTESEQAEEPAEQEDYPVLSEPEEETAASPEPSADQPAWYVVHCYSGYENKVRHNLEQRIETMGMKDKIFDVVVPTQEEIEVRDGKRRTVERHIFPGYVLVNMILTEESWFVVRNTPGVTGFVGMGSMPTPLRPEEVSQIIKRMEAEAPTVKVTYKVGERVRIIDGPFNDFRGTVSEIDMQRTKVRVMVSFFGRETPVELDFLQVEKA